jgi:hypothetical protein
MKVGVTYDTPKTKDALANNLHYMAMFAKPEQFGEHFWLMLKERGMFDADETFWICDGAKWEWKLKAYHDPGGGEIVDFIHAGEYLTKVANAIPSPEESSKCAKCMELNLRFGGGTQVLKALGKLAKTYDCEDLTKAITYFRNNHKRMDYPAYEALGYHITSSPVESACRHVVGDRVKRSGMRWTEEGAQFVTSFVSITRFLRTALSGHTSGIPSQKYHYSLHNVMPTSCCYSPHTTMPLNASTSHDR